MVQKARSLGRISKPRQSSFSSVTPPRCPGPNMIASSSFLPDSTWVLLDSLNYRRVFLSVFCLFSMRITPHVDVLLMSSCRSWGPCTPTLSSWSPPPICFCSGKGCFAQSAYGKAETLLCRQRSILMKATVFFFFFLEWILSYIEMKQPWVYMCSPSWSPLPPPSPPAPSRFSQCTRSERLSHASTLGWWSLSP